MNECAKSLLICLSVIFQWYSDCILYVQASIHLQHSHSISHGVIGSDASWEWSGWARVHIMCFCLRRSQRSLCSLDTWSFLAICLMHWIGLLRTIHFVLS